MKKISRAKRLNILNKIKKGISYKKLAAKTGVSKSTVFNILKENRVAHLKAKSGRVPKISKRLTKHILSNF